MRRPLLAPSVFVACSATCVFIACTTDYQMGLEDPKFGAPNSLAGMKQPGPTSEIETEGTGTAGNPACVKAGGTMIDGGACAVSFKTDILGAFAVAGCALAGTCHGGTSPPNPPRIDPASAGMWAEFASFTLQNGKPYINPCSTDVAASTISCNVNAAAPCGSLMPPGVGLAADVVAKIDLWVKCGSPNN